MTNQEAQKLLESSKELPIHEDVILGCLHKTGDTVAWKQFADVDLEEFVEALRKSGLI